ncbi:RCC1 domain-containing protein, partial [Rhodococcus chondri]|nr:serine/threonine protein kinase [Rhodococcus sp. CC-R104]
MPIPHRTLSRPVAVLAVVAALLAVTVGAFVWWPRSEAATAATPAPADGATRDGGARFAVSATGWHTCAIKAGNVGCWGANDSGQLGDGSTGSRYAPVTVALPGAATAVTTGREHSCAVVVGGDTYCWGYNTFGQLGTGTTDAGPAPMRVDVPGPVAEIT